MKIGINARTFAVDEPGGAVQVSINHTKHLIDRSDTDVVLFGHESLASLFSNSEIDSSLYLPNSQVYGLLWERTALPYLIKKHDLDVLYCPNGNAPVTSVACPVVMCIHDVNALKGWSNGIHQVYRRIAVPRGAKVADRIVTVSEFSKHEITKKIDISSERVEVVYNGIDPLFFSSDSGEELMLPDDYILFVGSMNPRKNIQGVISAFEEVKQTECIPHKLVIIGPDNKSIFKNIEIEKEDHIVMPGFVTDKQLKYAYENADVFVYPSLYEGFGLPPLEAMACGTPVIASNRTSLPEILDDAAVLVPPRKISDIASTIATITTDVEYHSKLAKKGKNHAEKYTWENSNDDLLKVMRQTFS
ncbi:glycosyltransferase family 4 protein [Natrinema soli]|uniref:Glycosyltransferase family 4 protein n=1 Tax=Natrinema soli TaxID=1930624 RepID=A0ABD5SNY8_9EURY|nr:glycosyltransferase family 1 protein [Natrinema soli]